MLGMRTKALCVPGFKPWDPVGVTVCIRITIFDVNKFVSREISGKYPLDKRGSPSYPAPAEKQVLIRPESEQVLIGIIQKQEEESS
jgi:hypothetical protein